jgi:hypothetical protein
MPSVRVVTASMGPAEEAAEPDGPDMQELRAVVPARAVLTELARGFLLVHETNPDRAVQFAATFLREQARGSEPTGGEASRPVGPARRPLGRLPRGAVDPSNFPPTR